MSARVLAALLLVLLVPVAAPLAGAAAPSEPLPRHVVPGSLDAQVTAPDQAAENTTLYLQVRPDGDARWTIIDTYALRDENETRAFQELGSDFASGERDAGWLAAFRAAADAASTATGREMTVTDVSRDYLVRNGTGSLVLEFTWTDFATVGDDRVVVGDAFNTTDGTWLSGLTAEQRLVISAPQGYGVRNGPAPVQDGQLRFEGPRTFDPGYLRIVYSGDASPDGDGDPNGGLFSGSSIWLGGAALLILGLAAAVGYMARYGAIEPGADDGDETHGSAAGAAGAGGDEDVDLSLLSDEERVERLLEQNGGRMKQARIVKETGWSNAKVSQLLSSMDDEDRINKLRIGRENLISFPDEEIGDFEE